MSPHFNSILLYTSPSFVGVVMMGFVVRQPLAPPDTRLRLVPRAERLLPLSEERGVHIMQLCRKKEVRYTIDCATYPQSDQALRDLSHKHGVCPVSSFWVNRMNEERPGRITIYVYVVGPYRYRARSVTVGAIVLQLVTFIRGSQWTCLWLEHKPKPFSCCSSGTGS